MIVKIIGEIGNKTKIQLGLAVVVIGGGASWMTTLWATTNSNNVAVQKQEAKIDVVLDEISKIKTDFFKTRPEALSKAIEKASEIFNNQSK